MTIGERIKAIREENGMTQTELADAIGTTKQNIYKYENNIVTNIPSDRIEAIARIFKITPAYLMGWTDDVVRKDIGSIIANRRKLLEISIEQLAEEVGEDVEIVKSWEDGYVSNMYWGKILKLAKTLQINPVRLLGVKVTHMIQPDDPRFMNLLTLYHSLNDMGKEKAIERLEELSEIERYRKNEGDGDVVI